MISPDDPDPYDAYASFAEERAAIVRVIISGQALRPGDGILVLLAADAESFAFGAGRHACPARAFAITVACAGVSALLPAGPWPTAPSYHASANARIPLLYRIPG